VVKVKNIEEAKKKIKGNGREILVARYLDENYKPIFKKIAGYVLQDFSSIGWHEIEKENPELTAIAGANDAMNLLKEGQLITIDGQEKLVYDGNSQ